jgi:hypothetical protein
MIHYEKLSDEKLSVLLTEVSIQARGSYKLKKDLEEETIRRALAARPAEISDAEFEPEEAPGGLTQKQITRIREWAKKKRTTQDLIEFITELIGGNE